MGLVLWKPLYFVSIGMFVLSLVLLPFSSKWSIVTILALVTLWSRVPGFVSFIFNKLALNDLFAFIVGASMGGKTGAIFGVFGILGARIFGPNEWWPYSLRASVAVFFAGLVTPLIVKFTGGITVTALYWFEAVLYFVYYLQVVLWWREEIGLEVAILPAVIFFDFFLNAAFVKMFGNTVSNMMTHGLSSGWPFIVFSGIILGFIFISRNGDKIAPVILEYKNKFIFWKKSENQGSKQKAPEMKQIEQNQFKIPKEMEKYAVSTHEELMEKKGIFERLVHSISKRH